MRVGRQQRVAKGICGREEGRTTPREREESGRGGGLNQSKGSNSSRVNSEIGSRDLRHGKGKGRVKGVRDEDSVTPPTRGPGPLRESSRQQSQREPPPSGPPPSCPFLPLSACWKARQGEKTMEPDRTQIKLDPR